MRHNQETLTIKTITIMRKQLVWVSVNVNGIYSWGKGWESTEMSNLWNEYWGNIKSCIWKYTTTKDNGACGSLYSVFNVYYNHPMGGNFMMQSGSCSYNGNPFGYELNELTNLFNECAKFFNNRLGKEVVKCEVTFSDVEEVVFGETKNVI